MENYLPMNIGTSQEAIQEEKDQNRKTGLTPKPRSIVPAKLIKYWVKL